jgi:hypothetical protein
MTYHQGMLFPLIPDPSETRVRTLLEPFYDGLRRTVLAPWEDVQQRRLVDPAFRRRKGADLAWWLHGELVHQAQTVFDNKAIRHTRLTNGMFALILRDDLLITVKKLKARPFKGRRRFERSNYLTDTNMSYHEQRRLSGFPDIPRVVLGYLLTKEETDIEIYIAYPRTRQRDFIWYYELPGQAGGELHLLNPQPDGPMDDEPKKGFTITPKKDVRESGET